MSGQVPTGFSHRSSSGVPSSTSSREAVGIVGDGRVARHFQHYIQLEGFPVSTWSRKSDAAPELALKDCRVILLLISDPAIEPVARELQQILPNRTWFHFSGSLTADLAAAAHPLMTFGTDLYELEVYRSVVFVGEKDRIDAARFHSLLPALSANRYFTIESEKRALYHALCVMAGNFTGFLWAKLFHEFSEQLGLPAEAALPYLQRITANISAHPNEPLRYLTGPLVRRDLKTIEKQLSALADDPYSAVYRAFTQVAQVEGVPAP